MSFLPLADPGLVLNLKKSPLSNEKRPPLSQGPSQFSDNQISESGGHVDGVAFFQGDVGFFHVFPLAQLAAEALDLTLGDGGVDRFDLHTKESFDSFFDLRLVEQ